MNGNFNLNLHGRGGHLQRTNRNQVSIELDLRMEEWFKSLPGNGLLCHLAD